MGVFRVAAILLAGVFFLATGPSGLLIRAYAEEPSAGKIPFSFSVPKNASGERQEKSPWNQLETRHTVIRYETKEDLKRFDGKVNFLPSDYSLKSLFTETAPQELEGKIREKIDALYERVQEILDMRKKTEKKVFIQLYPDNKKLAEAYRGLFGGELTIRAWYIYEINTIFLNLGDIQEEMLAHEMAHAIIDNYLTTRPPRASSEILAVYVHTHLFKKTKKYGPFE